MIITEMTAVLSGTLNSDGPPADWLDWCLIIHIWFCRVQSLIKLQVISLFTWTGDVQACSVSRRILNRRLIRFDLHSKSLPLLHVRLPGNDVIKGRLKPRLQQSVHNGGPWHKRTEACSDPGGSRVYRTLSAPLPDTCDVFLSHRWVFTCQPVPRHAGECCDVIMWAGVTSCRAFWEMMWTKGRIVAPSPGSLFSECSAVTKTDRSVRLIPDRVTWLTQPHQNHSKLMSSGLNGYFWRLLSVCLQVNGLLFPVWAEGLGCLVSVPQHQSKFSCCPAAVSLLILCSEGFYFWPVMLFNHKTAQKLSWSARIVSTKQQT